MFKKKYPYMQIFCRGEFESSVMRIMPDVLKIINHIYDFWENERYGLLTETDFVIPGFYKFGTDVDFVFRLKKMDEKETSYYKWYEDFMMSGVPTERPFVLNNYKLTGPKINFDYLSYEEHKNVVGIDIYPIWFFKNIDRTSTDLLHDLTVEILNIIDVVETDGIEDCSVGDCIEEMKKLFALYVQRDGITEIYKYHTTALLFRNRESKMCRLLRHLKAKLYLAMCRVKNNDLCEVEKTKCFDNFKDILGYCDKIAEETEKVFCECMKFVQDMFCGAGIDDMRGNNKIYSGRSELIRFMYGFPKLFAFEDDEYKDDKQSEEYYRQLVYMYTESFFNELTYEFMYIAPNPDN